jgi:glycosyltransferase involved in cell wall biosynthesis
VFRELWDEAALFVDPFDEHAIAATVDGLASDPQRREQLGEASRLRAARFTPDQTAAAMLDLYAGLLSESERVAA